MSRHWAFVVLMLAASPLRVWAQGGPPYFTDDTGTPGNRKWEINIPYTPLRLANQSTIGMPALDMNYGLGDRVELTYQLAWERVRRGSSPAQYGLSQSAISTKWRFLDHEGGFEMSVYPQAAFNNPTDSVRRGIVPPGASLTIPLQWSRQIGPIAINGDVGYSIIHLDSDDWLAGIIVGHEKRIGRKKSRGTEFAAEYYVTGNVGGAIEQTTIDAGVRYQFAPAAVLLVMAGRNVQPARSSFAGYLGVQLLLPPRSSLEP